MLVVNQVNSTNDYSKFKIFNQANQPPTQEKLLP